MAKWCKANGEEVEVPVPSMEDAERMVGGKRHVERVFPRHRMDMMFLCHDEGAIRGFPINKVGCDLYGTSEHGIPIHGDIVVMTREEGRGWY